MNYILMPSLGHMALVAIAVSLWKQENAMAFIYSYYFDHRCYIREESWQRMEDEMWGKILQLQLPDALKGNLMGCIKPIGLQILNWIKLCCNSGIKEGGYLVNDVCFTSNGTVDAKRTAGCLIKNENLDICKRYELACVFCLEKDIPELWNKIPMVRSKGYYSKYVRVLFPNKLALLWAYDMKGELNRLARPIATHWDRRSIQSPYEFAFRYSVEGGNRPGAEYFFQKITPTERRRSLVSLAERAVKRDHPEVFCFLLSQMDREELMEVYSSFPEYALPCLLNWPCQNLFMEMASNVWNFLSEFSYEYVLQTIVEKVKDGYKDYDYQTLFRNFWTESSAAQKRFVLDNCVYGKLLTELSRIKDSKSISLLLRYAIVEVRDARIFAPQYVPGCKF